MSTVKGLYYTKSHEWARVEDGKAYIGITDHAQTALGDIVYVELPEVDAEISQGDDLAVVESVKTASDIYSPVSGTVVEAGSALEDNPAAINADPYGSHIAVIALSDESELGELMDEEAYTKLLEEISE